MRRKNVSEKSETAVSIESECCVIPVWLMPASLALLGAAGKYAAEFKPRADLWSGYGDCTQLKG
jgi:hypothetical protein